MNIGRFRFPHPAMLLAVLMLFVTGCSQGTDTATLTAQSEETDITVAALPSGDLAGLYLAQADGFFAQQGLHVTIKRIASSQAIISSQLAGKIDIGAGSYVPYISAQAAGARFRILAEGSILLTGTHVLVVPADSKISTIADLAGKKIGMNGTNSVGTLLISALLAAHGIAPDRVDFVTDPAGFPAMPAALAKGTWNAAFLAEPYVTLAEEKYGERVLADLDAGTTVSFPISGFVATQAWADKYPQTVAAFIRAVEQGQSLADTDPSAARTTMAASDDLSSDITAVMALASYPTGPVDTARIQREANVMLEFGFLSAADSIEVSRGTLVAEMVDPG
jgi:NitT/TauT family transport system substrate-binding protein